jgi:hypothetical protein
MTGDTKGGTQWETKAAKRIKTRTEAKNNETNKRSKREEGQTTTKRTEIGSRTSPSIFRGEADGSAAGCGKFAPERVAEIVWNKRVWSVMFNEPKPSARVRGNK